VIHKQHNSETSKAQIPLHGPDQTLSETSVYDPVSDKVRFGLHGFPTSLRTLSGRRLVRSISTCMYFDRRSGRVVDKVRGSVQWNSEMTRPDLTSKLY